MMKIKRLHINTYSEGLIHLEVPHFSSYLKYLILFCPYALLSIRLILAAYYLSIVCRDINPSFVALWIIVREVQPLRSRG